MTRWLVAAMAALIAVLAGYLLFLNPEPVAVRLTPTWTVDAPLAGALLVAFASGAVLAGLAAAARASARGWRSWRAGRQAARETKRAQAAAHAQELVWAGDYAQARAELMRAEGSAPSEAQRATLLAETYLHEGNLADARRVVEEALVNIGLDARLLDLLAEVAERAGDLRGAAEALERARAAQPASPRLARRLRDVYAAAERWPEAMAVQGDILLQVRDADVLRTEEQILRGLRYQAALGQPEARDAVRMLVALTREDPYFVPAFVSAGDFLERNGRRMAARRAWERGARRRPATVLLERLEHLNADEGRPERTARLLRRLRRRHPDDGPLLLFFARHLILRGALDEATEVLSALPPSLAGDPLAHALWGELHRRRGEHHIAADTFVRAYGTDLAVLTPFRCRVCRRVTDRWSGYCAECRRWGTYGSRVELASEQA
jgi:tetratricopeptide (TPR) repeat protein